MTHLVIRALPHCPQETITVYPVQTGPLVMGKTLLCSRMWHTACRLQDKWMTRQCLFLLQLYQLVQHLSPMIVYCCSILIHHYLLHPNYTQSVKFIKLFCTISYYIIIICILILSYNTDMHVRHGVSYVFSW